MSADIAHISCVCADYDKIAGLAKEAVAAFFYGTSEEAHNALAALDKALGPPQPGDPRYEETGSGHCVIDDNGVVCCAMGDET